MKIIEYSDLGKDRLAPSQGFISVGKNENNEQQKKRSEEREKIKSGS